MFMRENCFGPSIFTLYVEETKAPLPIGGPLPDTVLNSLTTKNESLQELLLKHFEKDSEQLYIRTQFLVILYTIEYLITEHIDQNEALTSDPSIKLWKARFFYTYDRLLTSSVVHLKDNSLILFEEVVQHLETINLNSNDLAMILVEQSYCQLNFYKYKKAKKSIKRAKEILNLNFSLTGKLGRRTKYQEFDIAQLVLDVKSREVKVQEVKKQETTVEDG